MTFEKNKIYCAWQRGRKKDKYAVFGFSYRGKRYQMTKQFFMGQMNTEGEREQMAATVENTLNLIKLKSHEWADPFLNMTITKDEFELKAKELPPGLEEFQTPVEVTWDEFMKSDGPVSESTL